MTKISVAVTAEDIAAGAPRQTRSCPVALALRRRVGANYVSVGEAYMVWGDVVAIVPKEVQDFISAFDAGREVKPFEFELEAP